MVMQRCDPYRELRHMEDTVNYLWQSFGPEYREGSENWNILIDVIKKPEAIEVKASLPGFSPEDVDVAVEEDVLTLKAERKEPGEETDRTEYLIRERPAGSFYRALRLPDTVDTEKIESTYEHGVLTIHMPLAEEKKKKQIKINVAGAKEPEAVGTK